MHYFRGKFIQIKREMLHFSTKITKILTFIKKFLPNASSFITFLLILQLKNIFFKNIINLNQSLHEKIITYVDYAPRNGGG
jgi:oligoribonuclease (3'-5' exoribonuclease)